MNRGTILIRFNSIETHLIYFLTPSSRRVLIASQGVADLSFLCPLHQPTLAIKKEIDVSSLIEFNSF